MSLKKISYSNDEREIVIEKIGNNEECIKISFLYEDTDASYQAIALSLYDAKLLATFLLSFTKEKDNG